MIGHLRPEDRSPARGTVLRRAVRRTAAILAVLSASSAASGCGSGGGDGGVTLPEGGTDAGTFTYRGSTSQRQRLRIDVDGKLLAKLRILLRCGDGTSTQAAIATAPHRPTLEADGSFYYAESGQANFSPYGSGRYRVAMTGQLQGADGAGSTAFRISFPSTSCRASATWQARRQGGS
jgi:hypothetical protein